MVARRPPEAPNRCLTSSATPVKKRALLSQHSSQNPRSVGSHWTVLSHMTIPEPITGVQGMECADWPNLEQEVGAFFLDDESVGRDSIWRENRVAITGRRQGGCWACMENRCHPATTHRCPGCHPGPAPPWPLLRVLL